MCSSLRVYANQPETVQASDTGMAENDDKIRVILPTDAVGIFDFILDPQELISKTNASAYDGKLFEEGATLFFKRSEGESLVDYSSTSDAVTIVNRSLVPVNVVITAGITVQAGDEFAMTDDKGFADDTRPSLYLALTDGETEVPIMGEGEEAASLTITIPPASEEEEGSDECAFRLTGAANKEGDWSRLGNISFEVDVTWTAAAEQQEAPEEEEADLEGGGTDLSEKKEAVQPVSVSSEEITRKIVPVVTNSNVTLNKEEDASPAAEMPSDNQAAEEVSDREKKGKVQEEKPADVEEPGQEDTKELEGEKDVSP